MTSRSDERISEAGKQAVYDLAEVTENKPIAELVFEEPCPHMIKANFKPCLAQIEVFKYKLVSRMAEVMGFPSETHKLLRISPNDGESFPAFVCELNFGSKKLFSSGTYMHCLQCAKFKDTQMTSCSDSYTVCVSYDFLVRAAKVYVETIRFFGPRKCNCQSYAYYMLNILGVPTDDVLKDHVVETASAYISDKVKELSEQMVHERPSCAGDPHPRSRKTEHITVEPLPIPTTLEQFELDEYDDPIGKKYKKVFLGCSLMTTSIFFAILAAIMYFLLLKYATGK